MRYGIYDIEKVKKNELSFKYIKNNDAGLILVTHEHELANRCDKVYKLEDLTLQEIK